MVRPLLAHEPLEHLHHDDCRSCESRLPVGSSARMMRGSLATARAMATRCCWPPESWCGRRSRARRGRAVEHRRALGRSRPARAPPRRSIGIITFSSTVNSGSRKWNWKTKPSFSLRSAARSSSSSWPMSTPSSEHLAARRAVERAEQIEQRALARAAEPGEAHELALANDQSRSPSRTRVFTVVPSSRTSSARLEHTARRGQGWPADAATGGLVALIRSALGARRPARRASRARAGMRLATSPTSEREPERRTSRTADRRGRGTSRSSRCPSLGVLQRARARRAGNARRRRRWRRRRAR